MDLRTSELQAASGAPSRKRQRGEEKLTPKKKRGKENCSKAKARSSRRSVKAPKKFCPSEEAAKPQWSDDAACARNAAQDLDKQFDKVKPKDFVGKNVKKFFSGHGWFRGQIISAKGAAKKKGAKEVYNIEYTDGDTEEMLRAEVIRLLSAPLIGDDHQAPVRKLKKKSALADAKFDFELVDMTSDFSAKAVPSSYPFKTKGNSPCFYSEHESDKSKTYRVRKLYKGEQRPYIDEGSLEELLRAQMQEELNGKTEVCEDCFRRSASLWGGSGDGERPALQVKTEQADIKTARIPTPTAVAEAVEWPPTLPTC
jgi:hypothetical protein